MGLAMACAGDAPLSPPTGGVSSPTPGPAGELAPTEDRDRTSGITDPPLSEAVAVDGWSPTLARIDAILVAAGGTRVEVEASFCDRGVPMMGSGPRQYLCADSTLVRAWRVSAPHPGRGPVGAHLGLRRFETADALRLAQDRSLARYGGERASGHDGALAWCHAVATWHAEVLWTLEYGCEVSAYVTWLHEIRALLFAEATPVDGMLGPSGVVGAEGGWSWLGDAEGQPMTVSAERRRTRFVRVTGVAPDDVLWVRAHAPNDGGLAPKVGSLGPDASCVPLVYEPFEGDWWRVESAAGVGWAHRRHLIVQDVQECVTVTQ
jgi:hypothetical protein